MGTFQSHCVSAGVLLVGLMVLSLGVNAAASAGDRRLPVVTVYKNPSCQCCNRWVRHLIKKGFTVRVASTQNLEMVKRRVGVPFGLGACHTSEVGGYFVEGHVPAQDVHRLLQQRPTARGLVVPGMPVGSPGMEAGGGEIRPYQVLLVNRDGSHVVFSRHGK